MVRDAVMRSCDHVISGAHRAKISHERMLVTLRRFSWRRESPGFTPNLSASEPAITVVTTKASSAMKPSISLIRRRRPPNPTIGVDGCYDMSSHT